MNKLKVFIGILVLLIISSAVFVFIKTKFVKNDGQIEIIENDIIENINEDIAIIPLENESTLDLYKILNSNLLLLLDQDKINDLSKKFDENILKEEEENYIKGFYNDLINYGGILYPEAGIILKQCIYGNGEELIIRSNYFFESQMIKNILERNSGKEIIGPIIIKTNEDPRIGYAINGFYIKNVEDMEIYQYIEFAERNDKEIYTPFEINGIKAILPHRLIRIFEEDNGCKGFAIRIRKE
ncbi:hypothetical protein FACS189476_06770 [Spirochaetia bacterium]|nr:hypothetical protein FACS189476_06770 [Spirochaetia bacterium]